MKTAACWSFNWTLIMSQVNDNNQIHQLRHSAFIYSFVCLYIILFHLSTTTSMPPKSPTKKSTEKWNIPETEALISFLRRSQLGLEAPVSRRVPLLLQQIVLSIFILMVPSRWLHIVGRNGQV